MNPCPQDWDPVVLHRPKTPASSKRPGPTYSAEASRLHKIAESDVPIPTKTLSHESRQELMKARIAKGWSQVELNTKCSFPANTIRDIESGRSTPSGAQLSLLNRHLGIKLALSRSG